MPDPKQLADLPFAAFLIALGLAVFGILWRGVLRWEREVLKAEASEAKAWKAADTSTENTIKQAGQIESLTESVERLTRVVEHRAGIT